MNNDLFLSCVLTDSTLKRMTKAELIKRIRCLENERKDLIARIKEAKDEAINANKALLKALRDEADTKGVPELLTYILD